MAVVKPRKQPIVQLLVVHMKHHCAALGFVDSHSVHASVIEGKRCMRTVSCHNLAIHTRRQNSALSAGLTKATSWLAHANVHTKLHPRGPEGVADRVQSRQRSQGNENLTSTRAAPAATLTENHVGR